MNKLNLNLLNWQPLCPICGVAMRLKMNRKTGLEFLGCSKYPTCKHAIPMPGSGDPTCLICYEPMIARSRKSDGNRFWGCSSFPLCHGIQRMTCEQHNQVTIREIAQEIAIEQRKLLAAEMRELMKVR